MNHVTNSSEFRGFVLNELGFRPMITSSHYTYYENASREQYHYYFRDQCYEFGIANYTIDHNFQLTFSNPTRLIRFGIVYSGTTHFKLKNEKMGSFSPSPFFVVEDSISGMQVWKKGQHFQGIEVTLYADYFNKVVEKLTGRPFDFTDLETNHTYHYLSHDMIHELQQLHSLAVNDHLNPIYLESKMLAFIALICNETFPYAGTSGIFKQEKIVSIPVGKRTLHLTTSDLNGIRKAHMILMEEYADPPTIEALSQMVLVSTQKLKAGFLHQYHQTIGTYITTLKMASAANLLCSTDLHINEISAEVGYSHPGNFIKMFQKYYGKTPLQYRMEH